MTAIPTATDIGFPVRVHRAADVGPDRAMADIAWFIVHDTEGQPGGDEQVLTSPADPIESAHALILPDGTLVFMVGLTSTAWTPGNDNVAVASINVELSGFERTGYTDPQYRSLAAFFRWCRSQGMTVPAEYVARDERPGIIGHQDVADPYNPGQWGGAAHHTDPGPLFDWAKLVSLIAGPPPPPSETRFFPQTGHAISHGFKAFWEHFGGLSLFGFPITDEEQENGLTVQYFERARFEWHPVDGDAAAFNVELGRVGAELLALRTARTT